MKRSLLTAVLAAGLMAAPGIIRTSKTQPPQKPKKTVRSTAQVSKSQIQPESHQQVRSSGERRGRARNLAIGTAAGAVAGAVIGRGRGAAAGALVGDLLVLLCE